MAVITITNDNFEQEVLKSDKPVLIDFWAAWCGPCRMLAPVVEQFAAENPSVAVGKVNVDEQGALAEMHGIMSIPTLVVYKNGVKTAQAVGGKSAEEILALVNRE